MYNRTCYFFPLLFSCYLFPVRLFISYFFSRYFLSYNPDTHVYRYIVNITPNSIYAFPPKIQGTPENGESKKTQERKGQNAKERKKERRKGKEGKWRPKRPCTANSATAVFAGRYETYNPTETVTNWWFGSQPDCCQGGDPDSKKCYRIAVPALPYTVACSSVPQSGRWLYPQQQSFLVEDHSSQVGEFW